MFEFILMLEFRKFLLLLNLFIIQVFLVKVIGSFEYKGFIAIML